MNIAKQIEQGGKLTKANCRIDIGINDIEALAGDYMAQPTRENLITLIVNAYKVGLAVGTRNGQRNA